jgi:short-subunit dehydrogenase
MKKAIEMTTHVDQHRFGPWAVVTGASSGIGKEFARQLAANGLHVVLVARRLTLLEELGDQLAKEFGVQYRAISVDLSEKDFLEKIAAATDDLDVGLLVSNAGAGNPNGFLSIPLGDLHTVVRLNIHAHLGLTQYFGPKLAERRRGGVILVSALGAAQGLPYMANDGATKAYVLSLGEALHIEFEKLGVNVTVLLPGGVDTPVIPKLGLDVKTMPKKPISVDQCVSETLAALNANRAVHIPGRMFRMMTALIPNSMMTRMNGIMLAKAVAAKRTQQAR